MRQRELWEKSLVEEVDDDFIEVEVEQTNEPEKNEQRENFQNENPETAVLRNDAITVEEDPNERPCSKSSKKDGSSSQRDKFTTKTIKTKKLKQIHHLEKKARISDSYRNALLITLCITPMSTSSIQMTFLLQETIEAQ